MSNSNETMRQARVMQRKLDPEDVELPQDMVVSISEAVRKRSEAEGTIMGPIAGGLGIPGLS